MLQNKYGLVGKNISYSFSKNYFTERFKKNNDLVSTYENFDIQEINDFSQIIKFNPALAGLNITIPYKESVLPFLDSLSKNASKIGAVNTIKIGTDGKLKGFNTDYYGFKKALEPLLNSKHKNALILGTGGASKGVAFALDKLGIPYTFVSRTASEKAIGYEQIDSNTFENYQIIINSTPLGTSPRTEQFPPIPYDFFTKDHIAFDLIYNPAETEFLKRAKQKGAVLKNGMEMLVFQAEKAWEIWNK